MMRLVAGVREGEDAERVGEAGEGGHGRGQMWARIDGVYSTRPAGQACSLSNVELEARPECKA